MIKELINKFFFYIKIKFTNDILILNKNLILLYKLITMKIKYFIKRFQF